MTTRSTWIRRMGYAAVAAGTALVGRRLYRSYRSDVDEAYARIESATVETVETSVGTVEYARRGVGPPVLVAHGIVGGFDRATATGTRMLGSGFEVIAPSRFGYLGSTLPDDPTPENQARAYAELLDELGIDRVTVLGVSAGGAPAIAFALEYPERTTALVLVAADTPSESVEGPTGPPRILLDDAVFWLLCTYGQPVLYRLFGVDGVDVRSATSAEQAELRALIAGLLPVEPRVPGIENDSRVTNVAMAERSDEFPPEDLQVPVLVVHARDDPLADFEDARRLAERAPDAELRAFETGGHLLFGHGDAVQERISGFVAERCGPDRSPHDQDTQQTDHEEPTRP